jgi:hypothetical protein
MRQIKAELACGVVCSERGATAAEWPAPLGWEPFMLSPRISLEEADPVPKGNDPETVGFDDPML